MDDTLSAQVTRLIDENRYFRIKSDSDELTIARLGKQYRELSEQVAGIRAQAAADVMDANITRDQAIQRFDRINTLLMGCADQIMQALRAKEGDLVPEIIPDRPTKPYIVDDRLPTVSAI